ncbi:hypothetical protein [Aneurinibacillus aneurinilyticus]|uniref:Uncharacterized protein n=2 Tax=Aneurinibacillus aneurinilyticus TaxID=1391 RepID=A0A848CXB5_ANEAE|nr:hypothetical protein [Aneurinibacillus aneurinilyticus]ERI06271.1 hypothetical protein HMPREF0083_05371 [Aneurinibacillus aneurinilyticus ATCC 12856]MCI1694278.1 hypothetical protein [Aneurinibacillus aneurinilyticus]MED0707812.1 hypothetical protein [Aneurinibacillus aneurinilyticus]MED0723301.1 hypothetical protein [Aneurinibacillus aneurinilyticus]MED0742041.1 hypothetical protein [Aneurinibacillus aneurinilyticus]
MISQATEIEIKVKNKMYIRFWGATGCIEKKWPIVQLEGTGEKVDRKECRVRRASLLFLCGAKDEIDQQLFLAP